MTPIKNKKSYLRFIGIYRRTEIDSALQQPFYDLTVAAVRQIAGLWRIGNLG
jgi:hypothetical protein